MLCGGGWDAGLNSLSHSCSLACQQSVLKTFPGQRSVSLKVNRKYRHQEALDCQYKLLQKLLSIQTVHRP